MSDRFELLTDTHRVQVADYDKDQKWVFTQYSKGKEIKTLSKIVHSTEEMAITASEYEDIGIQDVPEELYDFLDSKGFDTESARSSTQFSV